jgi:hypothetical protein
MPSPLKGDLALRLESACLRQAELERKKRWQGFRFCVLLHPMQGQRPAMGSYGYSHSSSRRHHSRGERSGNAQTFRWSCPNPHREEPKDSDLRRSGKEQTVNPTSLMRDAKTVIGGLPQAE